MNTIFILLLITLSLSQNTTGKCGSTCEWTYRNNVLSITGSGAMDNYNVIRYTYPPWYEHRKTIKKIEISEGITTIGDFSFYGIYGITELSLPKTVTTLGEYSIAFCSGLTELVIPETITSIMPYAFRGCTKLQKLKYNGMYRPSNCTLSSFYDCHSLKEFTVHSEFFHNSVSFCEYKNLKTDDIDQEGSCGKECKWKYNSNEKHLEIYGKGETDSYDVLYAPFYLLKDYLKSCNVRKEITKIGNCTFWGIDNMETISIGSSVQSIGSEAFYNCSALKEVKFYGMNEIDCDENTFEDSPLLGNVSVIYEFTGDSFCGNEIYTCLDQDEEDEDAPEGSEDSDVGLILGIVFGCIGGLLLIILIVIVVLFIVFMILKKQKKSSYQALDGNDNHQQHDEEPEPDE